MLLYIRTLTGGRYCRCQERVVLLGMGGERQRELLYCKTKTSLASQWAFICSRLSHGDHLDPEMRLHALGDAASSVFGCWLVELLSSPLVSLLHQLTRLIIALTFSSSSVAEGINRKLSSLCFDSSEVSSRPRSSGFLPLAYLKRWELHLTFYERAPRTGSGAEVTKQVKLRAMNRLPALPGSASHYCLLRVINCLRLGLGGFCFVLRAGQRRWTGGGWLPGSEGQAIGSKVLEIYEPPPRTKLCLLRDHEP